MKTLAAVRLRNQLREIRPELKIQLRNVRVNGQLRGCSGFVTDPGSGRIVYLNTDIGQGVGYDDRGLYRTAEHDRDYTGGRNRFSPYEELAASVVELLGKPAEFRGRNR